VRKSMAVRGECDPAVGDSRARRPRGLDQGVRSDDSCPLDVVQRGRDTPGAEACLEQPAGVVARVATTPKANVEVEADRQTGSG
jgi:hypothetical protein